MKHKGIMGLFLVLLCFAAPSRVVATTIIYFTPNGSFTVTPGGTDQKFGAFNLYGASNKDFTGISIRLDYTRTGVSNFKLWVDANRDGEPDVEGQLGSTVTSDPGVGQSISFSGFQCVIGDSPGKDYLLTCDVASDATGSIAGIVVQGSDIIFDTGTSIDGTFPADISGGDVSLPVELSSFTAQSSRGGIVLQWITESEIENVGFIIDRRQTTEDESQNSWTEIAHYSTEAALRGQGSVTYRTQYEYTDKTVEPWNVYHYRLSDIDYHGTRTYHTLFVLGVEATDVPINFVLMNILPNPFNSVTTISFTTPSVSAGADVSGQMVPIHLQVYDLKGCLIETLIHGDVPRGYHQIKWRPANIPNGVYICTLEFGNFSSTQKLTLIK